MHLFLILLSTCQPVNLQTGCQTYKDPKHYAYSYAYMYARKSKNRPTCTHNAYVPYTFVDLSTTKTQVDE